MQFKDFVNWVFYALLGFFAQQIVGDLKEMRQSIETLNINMATVVGAQSGLGKDVNRIEGRVDKLEARVFSKN